MITADSESATTAQNAKAGTEQGTGRAPLLRASRLTKSFGPTRALTEASLDLFPGEVHSLVGENGSGKSTLVKLLSGVLRPDSGSISINGVEDITASSPRAAIRSGIATVFQEVLVAGPRSVLDNVWLGAEGTFRGGIGRAEKQTRARRVLGSLLGEVPPLDQAVETLSISDRQACCIARALLREPRMLILDEATSALDVVTRKRLFAVLRDLVAGGGTVLFISHRMDEIDELSDRITVLRSGATVATLPQGATRDQIVTLMTGERPTARHQRMARPHGEHQKVALRASGLTLRPGARPFDFALGKGEVVGVAGLEGQGQQQFIEALWGVGHHGGDVDKVRGPEVTPIDSPRRAVQLGVGYVPRERRAEMLFENLSIADNFAITTAGHDTTAGFESRRRRHRRLAQCTAQLRIRLSRATDPISSLSGGNQQKVVIARWLAIGPEVLLLNDPTRGIDLGAKRDFYRLVTELADDGLAVVMVSTDLDELTELMDRVLIFRDFTTVADLHRHDLTQERLVASFFKDGTND